MNTRNYFRIMLGQKSVHADECLNGNFIGVDFNMDMNLEGKLPEDWRAFNKEFIPIYLNKHPDKAKISAGLACGSLWTVSKGIKIGDIVLCPNGTGSYIVGEVIDNYSYHPGEILPHRRTVKWYPKTVDRAEMSQALQNSTGSIGTVSNITKFSEEIESLIEGNAPAKIVSTDETVEDPSVFALEEHLEEFLTKNWTQTELGKNYDIYEEDGEIVGQQYPTDTGPIDILAISKDKKELLIVELKKGRASDHVVGQIQRYMGYVIEELAEAGQEVKGVIIALEDDIRIRRALAVAKNIEFYRYQVSFKLFKG
jgi:restriction system protein